VQGGRGRRKRICRTGRFPRGGGKERKILLYQHLICDARSKRKVVGELGIVSDGRESLSQLGRCRKALKKKKASPKEVPISLRGWRRKEVGRYGG